MTSMLRYIVMPRALQAMPSLLTYSARPPLGSIVEGAAIQPDEPVKVVISPCIIMCVRICLVNPAIAQSCTVQPQLVELILSHQSVCMRHCMCNMLLRMTMQSAPSMHVICICSYFTLCMCPLVLASNQQLDCCLSETT